METELTPIETLDTVLRLLFRDRGNARLEYIKSRLKAESEIEIDGDELIRILSKLTKDGYVEYYDELLKQYDPHKLSPIIDRLYWISFEGKLFFETGGYHQKQMDIASEREQLRIANRTNKLVNLFLVVGSILAGIGSICLAIVEIYKICHR